MAVGKSSVKRAIESSAPEVNEKAKEAAAKKTVTKSVITGTDEQVFTTVSQDEGINAHYGLNTPLPTFLL
ncbi:MAG: hypothetical protein IJU87_06015 [Lachnospiraceae bacterium]|nr:hypothetical protein [Lachnospiraceae bacterium]